MAHLELQQVLGLEKNIEFSQPYKQIIYYF